MSKLTFHPSHYQPAESAWRRAASERITKRMIERVAERARDTDPTLASAFEAHTAQLTCFDQWLPLLQFVDDIYDALSQRDDLTDQQCEDVQHWCLETLRAHLALPHLGRVGVCQICGAPAYDDDGEQPDACWAGECTSPDLEASLDAIEATNG